MNEDKKEELNFKWMTDYIIANVSAYLKVNEIRKKQMYSWLDKTANIKRINSFTFESSETNQNKIIKMLNNSHHVEDKDK